MEIRQATSQDAGFVRSLAARFGESSLPPWRTQAQIVEGTARQLDTAIATADGQHAAILIAEENGERLGFAWVLMLTDFYTHEPIGKISEIATVRSGTGAGAALMHASEEFARRRGARLMTLNVLEENRHARGFYFAQGYAPEYSMFAKVL
jgi:GNAT superfamily N-acetyltransferase